MHTCRWENLHKILFGGRKKENFSIPSTPIPSGCFRHPPLVTPPHSLLFCYYSKAVGDQKCKPQLHDTYSFCKFWFLLSYSWVIGIRDKTLGFKTEQTSYDRFWQYECVLYSILVFIVQNYLFYLEHLDYTCRLGILAQ